MTVAVRGITYDTGCETAPGRLSRPHFDPDQVERDLTLLGRDLHCDAVRLTGNDLDRRRVAAEYAAWIGLAVWVAPFQHNASPNEMLELVSGAAEIAASLVDRAAEVCLVVGWESSAFLAGMIDGETTFDRLRTLGSIPRLLRSTARHGSFNRSLSRHLTAAVQTARVTSTRVSGPSAARGVQDRRPHVLEQLLLQILHMIRGL